RALALVLLDGGVVALLPLAVQARELGLDFRRRYRGELAVAAVLRLGDALLDEAAFDFLRGGLRPGVALGEELGVAAEEDVRSAARHVRRDRDPALASRLRDDLRLALVLLRVQDVVRHAA